MKHSGFLHSKTIVMSVLAILLIGAAISYVYYHKNPRQGQNISSKPKPVLSPAQCLAKLPIGFLTGQVLMVGLDATDMPSQAVLFARSSIGGAIIMTAPNDINDSSIVRFKKAAASMGVPLLIATDEEGGSVQRFKILGALPSPQDVADTMTPAQAQQMITEHGKKLKAIGIDMVFGSLADVAPANGISPLGDRVFSSNPSVVKSFTLAYVKGWQAAGLLPTIKHFPGLGSATGNTDFAPATTPPLSELKTRDFIPYQGVISDTSTAVMIGNQTVPGWFTEPASLSSIPNQYLRKTLGYNDNLIVTDSLSAAAITVTTTGTQAVVKAIVAGNDMALIVESPDASFAQNKALIASLQSALQQAVKDNIITKKQLETSVLRKLNAQHINACSIKDASTKS